MIAARKCCGREPVVEFAAKQIARRCRVDYSVAVVCSVCGRRVDLKHVAIFILPEPGYETGVRNAATRQWNALFETSEAESER